MASFAPELGENGRRAISNQRLTVSPPPSCSCVCLSYGRPCPLALLSREVRPSPFQLGLPSRNCLDAGGGGEVSPNAVCCEPSPPRGRRPGFGPVQVLLASPASQRQLLLAESFRPLREVDLPLASPSHVSFPPSLRDRKPAAAATGRPKTEDALR